MILKETSSARAVFKTKGLCGVAIASISLLSSTYLGAAEEALVAAVTTERSSHLQAKSALSTVSKYRAAPSESAVEGQYIVVFKDEYIRTEVEALASSSVAALSASSLKNYKKQAVERLSNNMTNRYAAEIRQRFSNTLNGYSAKMSSWNMQQMLSEASVEYIEQDQIISIDAIQEGAPPSLDRIDQSDLPLDTQYTFDLNGGEGVEVYVIDTGIFDGHIDFEGRVDTEKGFNAVNDNFGTDDCEGHGTHVAGTVGSKTFGVAKQVALIPVRVLGCDGRGFISDVVAGVDHVTTNATAPAVANMSLGGGLSQTLDAAVQRSIESGVTYVVAAGNENQDACGGSPSGVADAITVAASDFVDSENGTDFRAGFSNFGRCVDIFAPGVFIESTFINSGNADRNNQSARLSGTSMAAPHVAGVAALILQKTPDFTPAEVSQSIEGSAARDKIDNSDIQGSPNLLLQISNGDDENPLPFEPTPTPVADNCDVQESFENGSGDWGIDNASTCTTGNYVVGAPTEQINQGIVTQVAGANSGNNAVFTAFNSSAGADDVDGGNCIARSPIYSVSQDSTLSMAVFHGQRDSGDDANDFFLVEVSTDGGVSFETLASNGDNQFSAQDWVPLSTEVAAGDQVVVRVQCSDGAGPGDLIECGIDDVNICSN
ncbi:MAG: S8 family peptidase [Cellvibrionaceae bacterium]|nr:S8 family peptidase [Cellvibrionaceae bacterium]